MRDWRLYKRTFNHSGPLYTLLLQNIQSKHPKDLLTLVS